MKIIKQKVVVEDYIDDVTCDICGQSCAVKVNEEHTTAEFMELKADWGFWSDKDEESWTAQVCEACVDKHLVPLINFNKPNKSAKEEAAFQRKFKINNLNKNLE